MEPKTLPLSGIKVVELATVVAAPTCARMLCAYGAEVIKVEALQGDVMRSGGVHEFVPYEDDLNPLFTIHNSNKKFLSLDLKKKRGRPSFWICLAMQMYSSQIFENNRSDVMDWIMKP